jgi:hypothetical protein
MAGNAGNAGKAANVGGNESSAAERRIALLIPIFGAVGAIAAAPFLGWRWAAGIAVGAMLSWINFQWLAGGVGVIARLSSVQSGAPRVRVPKGVYFKSAGRFILMLLAVYVILSRPVVPGLSVVVGFCAVILAAAGELVYELAHGAGSNK